LWRERQLVVAIVVSQPTVGGEASFPWRPLFARRWRNGNDEKRELKKEINNNIFSPLPFRHSHRQSPCEKRLPRAATENPLRLHHLVAVGWETATISAMAEIC